MSASTTRSRLQAGLTDVAYPAAKDDLVTAARRDGADEDTVRALRAVPVENDAGFSEVLGAVWIDESYGQDGTDAPVEAHRFAERCFHRKPGMSEREKDIPEVNPVVEERGENRGS